MSTFKEIPFTVGEDGSESLSKEARKKHFDEGERIIAVFYRGMHDTNESLIGFRVTPLTIASINDFEKNHLHNRKATQ